MLSGHTNEMFHAHFAATVRENEHKEIFWGFFLRYYTLWASMVYVVHEGFVELQVEDKRLDMARAAVDMKLLRRFRNATFHFQPAFRGSKHGDLIVQKGFQVARALSDRQDFLARKMLRLLKHNPLHDQSG
jgi:hypothetical protein